MISLGFFKLAVIKLKMQICCLSSGLIINAILSIITKNLSILSISYKTLHLPSNIKLYPFKCEKQGPKSEKNNNEKLLKNYYASLYAK